LQSDGKAMAKQCQSDGKVMAKWSKLQVHSNTNIISDQDCRYWNDLCDPNASCVETGPWITYEWTKWSCNCNPGFYGNGLICALNGTYLNIAEFINL
jgi:hypothetical protein